MLAAFTSWGLGVQDGLILARVQVPPLPLWLMVIQLTSRSTFWACPFDHVVVLQVNVDFACLQFQVHRVHKPRRLDAENAPIKLMILHPRHYRRPPVRDAYPLRTLNSHLLFKGQCEEAFQFYAQVLGGKIEGTFTFGASPMADKMPPAWKNKIMHMSMTVNGT